MPTGHKRGWPCPPGCPTTRSSCYTEFFFFKQKTAYEVPKLLEFRRVLFRSIVWMIVFALRPVIERVPWRLRIVLALPFMFLAGKQMLSLGLVAERLTTPVDVKQSIEYRSAQCEIG